MDYADFEGVIPEDQYGGGTVMVWDAGTYQNSSRDEDGNLIPMKDQLKNGHATFFIHHGKYEKRFLKKVDDHDADSRRDPTSSENRSVLTGRTMEQLQKDSAIAKHSLD